MRVIIWALEILKPFFVRTIWPVPVGETCRTKQNRDCCRQERRPSGTRKDLMHVRLQPNGGESKDSGRLLPTSVILLTLGPNYFGDPAISDAILGTFVLKSLCFPMCPGDAYWGHFAAKNVETSTNGLIQNDSGLPQGLPGYAAAV